MCTNKNTQLQYNQYEAGRKREHKVFVQKSQCLDTILSVKILKRAMMVTHKPTGAHTWKRKLKLWNSNCVYGAPYNALSLLIYKLTMYQ